MNKSFSWRAFISLGLFISFIMLLLSGVILYVGPSGKGAPGVVWEIIGLTKQGWQKQHIIFGFTFAILSLFHLSAMNWKTFFSYLKSKTTAGISRPVELAVIVLLALFVGIGTHFDLKPFSSVLDFGKTISKSWNGNNAQQQERSPKYGNPDR
jgi:hypothetical protein